MSTTLRYGVSAIKHAKAPEVGQLDYKIEGRPGLRLRVAASGLRTWTHLYRHEGRLRRGLIGSYPSKSLADADRLWSDARDTLRSGLDPYPSRAERKAEAQRKKTEAEVVAANTFRAAVEEYFADKGKGGGGRPKSRKVIQRRLELHAMPTLADKPLGSIARADIRDLTRRLVAADQPSNALHVHQNLATFFRWAVRNDRLAVSPMADIEKAADEASRDRVLDDSELGEIWRACDVLSAAPAAVVRVLMLTGARRTEAGKMDWSEVRDEEWHLPAERSKNGKPHIVPLAPLAREVIASAPTFAGCSYVFSTDGTNAVGNWSSAKEQIDRAITSARKEAGVDAPMPHWVFHDLRRTLVTGMVGG